MKRGAHEKLPDERHGITHRAVIGGKHVYLRTGEYPDGRLGELFITVDKHGAEMRLLDLAAITLSAALQRGVPLEAITSKWRGQRMGTEGATDDPSIPLVTSIADYVARWLDSKYGTKED